MKNSSKNPMGRPKLPIPEGVNLAHSTTALMQICGVSRNTILSWKREVGQPIQAGRPGGFAGMSDATFKRWDAISPTDWNKGDLFVANKLGVTKQAAWQMRKIWGIPRAENVIIFSKKAKTLPNLKRTNG